MICCIPGEIEYVALADHPTLYGGDTDDRFKWQGKSPANEAVDCTQKCKLLNLFPLQECKLLREGISVTILRQKSKCYYQ